jgi:iron complex outermembrane receptor protein
VGVKIQPRTWNSFVTASFFNIDQSNSLTTDPNVNHPYSSVQGGAVRSRGVELEAVTQIHHGLSLHGGYSLVATAYTQASTADNAEIGKWFPQVPRNQLSLLTDYTVPSGRLARFGGNFGVRFIGQSFGDSDNTLNIPNYTLLDGALRYTFRHTEFAVNATNLTDKTYVATCTGVAYCGYGYKRNVLGSARYHF